MQRLWLIICFKTKVLLVTLLTEDDFIVVTDSDLGILKSATKKAKQTLVGLKLAHKISIDKFY